MYWYRPMMYDFNFPNTFMGVFLFPLIAWSLAWKGWALWKAARNESIPWFIILLIVNTAGILDILYIFNANIGD